MATISKVYFHDSSSPNIGTLPTYVPETWDGTLTGEAAGATTNRDANGTIGTANPDIESQITAAANTLHQAWGHRRFMTRPLASQAMPTAAASWTWSYARSESNLNHNMSPICFCTLWRPTTGARVGTGSERTSLVGTEPTVAATEQAQSVTSSWTTATTCQEGDVIVFDWYDTFTQAMATAYTSEMAYDGTTEASTTTCASFVSWTTALTLSDNPWPKNAAINFQDPAVLMKAFGFRLRNWLWRPLKRPSLWTPELWRPEFWLPDHVAQGEIAI